MNGAALFVTGTGTGVGKTLVSAALVHEFRSRGEEPVALKPVISGYPDANGEPSDSEILLAAGGRRGDAEAIEAISPWRYRAPLSPDMAARREDRRIDFESLVAFTRGAQGGPGARVLVEGVGGICVPLDESHTVLDWIDASSLPVLLVAGSYLGTLSHTLSAVATLASRSIPIRGIVVSASPESPVPLEETRETLRNFTDPALPIALLPRIEGEAPWRRAPALGAALGI